MAPISDKLNIQGTLPGYISSLLCLHNDNNTILIPNSCLSPTGLPLHIKNQYFKEKMNIYRNYKKERLYFLRVWIE